MSPSPRFGAVWAEHLPLDEVHRALPTLARLGLAVHLAWPAHGDDAEHLELASEGLARGVSVRPWLLLPEGAGYWAGAENATVYADAARRWMSRWLAAGLPPTTWVVDMEPPHARVLALDGLLKGQLRAVPELWRRLRREAPADLAPARMVYEALVDDALAASFSPWLTTLPMVVDDLAHGRQTFCRWLGLPVMGPRWSVVSLQVYRTLFDDALPPRLRSVGFGSGLVTHYGELARKVFGARAGLDLGLIGGGVLPHSGRYASPTALAADLAAARLAGVPAHQVSVFSLEGALGRHPPDGEAWLAPPAQVARPAGARAKLLGLGMRALSRMGHR